MGRRRNARGAGGDDTPFSPPAVAHRRPPDDPVRVAADTLPTSLNRVTSRTGSPPDNTSRLDIPTSRVDSVDTPDRTATDQFGRQMPTSRVDPGAGDRGSGHVDPADGAGRGVNLAGSGVLYIPEDPRATGGVQGALRGAVAGQKARRARGVGGGNEAALQAVVDQRMRNAQPRMAQRAR